MFPCLQFFKGSARKAAWGEIPALPLAILPHGSAEVKRVLLRESAKTKYGMALEKVKPMNRNTQARQNAWRALAFLVLLGTLLVIPSTSRAQSLSNITNLTLNAVVQQSISVTVSAVAVNFNLVPGTGPTAGAPTVTVTTNWALNPAGSPTMSLYGYFTSSTAALTNGAGNNIPSANVLTSINAGAPGAFTGSGPFGAAGASR